MKKQFAKKVTADEVLDYHQLPEPGKFAVVSSKPMNT
jgi:hypothetical protein